MAELTDQNTKGTDEGQNDEDFNVTLGGREMTLVSPGSGSLAMFATAFAKRSGTKQVARLLDFFVARIKDEDDREFLEDSMLADEIELEDVIDAMEAAMEHWSEDPTNAPSGSASSSRTTGKRSTGASRRATKA